MALTEGQKKWVVGGGIGAAALVVGYALFHSRPASAYPTLPPAPRPPQASHEHRGRKKRRHDDHERHGRGEHANGRGEYGRKKKHHHHKGHHRHG